MDKIADQEKITIRYIRNKDHHDVMYAAAASPDDKVYFALCAEVGFAGSFAQLVCYDPATDSLKDVADLAGVIDYPPEDRLRHPHSKIHTAICFSPEGKLIAATHMTAPPVGEDSYHYWNVINDPERKFRGSHLIVHDPRTGSTEDFGIAVPGGGARWMTYNPERDEVYITGFLRCHFYSASLKTGEVKDHGRIAEHDFLGPCYCPADGRVYTSDSQGNFLRFTPETGKMEQLPLGIPDDFWASHNGRGIFNLLPSRDGKKLYGTTWMTHHIFEYDPLKGNSGAMRDLGTLGCEEAAPDHYADKRFFPRMLIIGHDGNLYFAAYNAVSPRRIPPHIFKLNPETLEQQDLGRIQVNGFAHLNVVASGCCTSDGTLFFGGERTGAAEALSFFIYNGKGVNKRPEENFKDLDLKHNPTVSLLPERTRKYHTVTLRDNQVFNTTGTIIVQEQGMSGTTPLIPRQAGRIGALAQDHQSGVVLGVTHGEVPRLFVYYPDIRFFQPLNTFGKAGEESRSLALPDNGKLYFGTSGSGEGALYEYDLTENQAAFNEQKRTDRGEFAKYYPMPSDRLKTIRKIGAPAVGEGILRMTALNGKLYGITAPGGDFFSFDPQTERFKLFPMFKQWIIQKQNLPGILIPFDDKIYFSGHHGHIIVFDTLAEAFSETGMKVPCGAGREYLTHMNCATPCGNGDFYCGTNADGILFRLDLANGKVVSLGRPVSENNIRALAYNRDHVLWGISGLDSDVCHLFRYTPEEGFTDEGIMRARMPKTWIIHRADVMLIGLDGEIFIGENDDISHLAVFLPPVRPWKKQQNFQGEKTNERI